MALDTRPRPQQTSMHFMPNDQVPPHFTNPWGSQDQLSDAASNLHALGKPTIRTSSVSSPSYLTAATASLPSNNVRHMSSPGSYPNPTGLMPNITSNPEFTTADMSMPGSTAPSPTTAGGNFMPAFTSAMEIPVQSRTATHYPDRRLSQPAMSTPMFLQADTVPKQRQASLTDFPYRPRGEFDFNPRDALDTAHAHGLVVMSQNAQQRPRGDGSHSFPHTHSASSSISSNQSYPYYNGGSVDSSATEYSDTTRFPSDLRSNGMPRSTGYVTSGATVPNQMMTTFSSKITTSTQKKHKCKVCDKRFTRPSSLQTHTYSHTGEKPFVCEQQGCGRRFSVVSNLRRHKKVHANKQQHAS